MGNNELAPIWRLPEVNLANWGRLGPGFGLGVGCGVGVGLGLVGGLGLGVGLPMMSVGFGAGTGCGIGLGFGYGTGRGHAWDRRGKHSNLANPKASRLRKSWRELPRGSGDLEDFLSDVWSEVSRVFDESENRRR
eukprot:TRINITY_DN18802_c0_g1_i1.p1 TRINITY_DN18802_c0_g1~~TRINITY_DN18802_c0_g1_i1.p1  ORF type:complete len:135 (-),score=16.22 TRINITY_DN18802_c0_g1_i1:284-688(-)